MAPYPARPSPLAPARRLTAAALLAQNSPRRCERVRDRALAGRTEGGGVLALGAREVRWEARVRGGGESDGTEERRDESREAAAKAWLRLRSSSLS
jgi:hypothetical protein